jgi:hypothetical protein
MHAAVEPRKIFVFSQRADEAKQRVLRFNADVKAFNNCRDKVFASPTYKEALQYLAEVSVTMSDGSVQMRSQMEEDASMDFEQLAYEMKCEGGLHGGSGGDLSEEADRNRAPTALALHDNPVTASAQMRSRMEEAASMDSEQLAGCRAAGCSGCALCTTGGLQGGGGGLSASDRALADGAGAAARRTTGAAGQESGRTAAPLLVLRDNPVIALAARRAQGTLAAREQGVHSAGATSAIDDDDDDDTHACIAGRAGSHLRPSTRHAAAVRRRRRNDGDDDGDGDAKSGRQRSHCGGGRRSVVRTKQQLLIAFAQVAMGADRMAWALFCVSASLEFSWCVCLNIIICSLTGSCCGCTPTEPAAALRLPCAAGTRRRWSASRRRSPLATRSRNSRAG